MGGKKNFMYSKSLHLLEKLKIFSLIRLVCVVFFFNSNTIKAKQPGMDSNFNRIVFLLELHIKNKGNL